MFSILTPLVCAALVPAAWFATWGTAPAYADARRSFEDVTLRQIIHVSIGGSTVRVRFTNRFGDAPLRIGAAAIALEDGAPQPGTIRFLHFMGSATAEVPPHADVYSDEAALAIPARSNLVIDLYLPQDTGPPTLQPLAYQTNAYALTNRVGDPSAQAFTWSLTSRYFLDSVEVRNNSARGAIAAFGDSITLGAGGVMNANDRWPDDVDAAGFGILNEGISGNRILLDHPLFGRDALARFDHDVLSQSGVRDVVIQLGINDIQEMPHQYDAARIEFGLVQLAQLAHAHGLRAIGGTLTPYEGWRTYDDRGEATREAVNAFIRSNAIFDALADFDRALRDPADPHRLLRAYDSGDHLHPNAFGHRAMAQALPVSAL